MTTRKTWRMHSLKLRTFMALIVMVIMSVCSAYEYTYNSWHSMHYQTQLKTQEENLELLRGMIDGYLLDGFNYAQEIAYNFKLRPVSVKNTSVVSKIEASKSLNSLKKCNIRIIDLCLYYFDEKVFINTKASYYPDDFAAYYNKFSNVPPMQLKSLYQDYVIGEGMGKGLKLMNMGEMKGPDEDNILYDALLLILPIPYMSSAPFATLGILWDADLFIEQLQLTAETGNARIIGSDGNILLEYRGNSEQDNVEMRFFSKHSEVCDITYELEIPNSVLYGIYEYQNLLPLCIIALAFSLVCIFFSNWVNFPIYRILKNIGRKPKLLENESSVIREYIGILTKKADEGRVYIDELIIRRLLFAQNLNPEEMERCETLLKCDYAHCCAFLVHLSQPAKTMLCLTNIQLEHSIINVFQESRTDTYIGILASDLFEDSIESQIGELLENDLFAGYDSIAIGPMEEEVCFIKRSFELASQKMKDMLYRGEKGISTTSDENIEQNGYPTELMHEMLVSIQNQNSEELQIVSGQLIRWLVSSNTSPDIASIVIYDIEKLIPLGPHEAGAPIEDVINGIERKVALLIETYRTNPIDGRNTINEKDNKWKEMVTCAIEEFLEKPEFGITLLAEEFHTSESSFSHMFKRNFGVTFINYVNNIKIERAKKMLEDSNNSIEFISKTLGYSSPSNFSRMFKNIVGISPTSYKQDH